MRLFREKPKDPETLVALNTGEKVPEYILNYTQTHLKTLYKQDHIATLHELFSKCKDPQRTMLEGTDRIAEGIGLMVAGDINLHVKQIILAAVKVHDAKNLEIVSPLPKVSKKFGF